MITASIVSIRMKARVRLIKSERVASVLRDVYPKIYNNFDKTLNYFLSDKLLDYVATYA